MKNSRAKAIREKCLDCCGGSKYEVKLCPCSKCALYPYRLGRISKGECLHMGEENDSQNNALCDVSEKGEDE